MLLGVPGMKTATRNQTSRLGPSVVGHPLVDFGTEANHFRRDIIDQHRPTDAGCVQIFQESFWRLAKLCNLIEIRPFMF